MHKCMRETGTEEHPPMFILIHTETVENKLYMYVYYMKMKKHHTQKQIFLVREMNVSLLEVALQLLCCVPSNGRFRI